MSGDQSGTSGLTAAGGAKVSVKDSVASGNFFGFTSVVFGVGSAELNLQHCLVANNTAAGVATQGTGAVARIGGCSVTDNSNGLQVGSGTLMESLGNNLVRNDGTCAPFLVHGPITFAGFGARQNGNGAVFGNGRASVDHCRFEGNLVDGVAGEAADVTIRDSVSAGNGHDGFSAVALVSENTVLNVSQCMSTNNGRHGFVAQNNGTGLVFARIANSSISENFGVGLDNLGGSGSVTLVSLGNNFVEGNIGGATLGTITPLSAH